MPSVCFFLHCSQLASNCGIKGVFVLCSLCNLEVVLRRRHDALCQRTVAVLCFVACLCECSLSL